MHYVTKLIPTFLVIGWLCLSLSCSESISEIKRPERIQSKRLVVYDHETYERLATSWEEYYNAFPSEDAYANWMYAARYAGHDDYEEKLEEGVAMYPANPTLLYLAGMCKHGMANYEEGRRRLERATELDPSFLDPWFSLVIHYMERGELERMDVALRRILENAAIYEEVMDYSYNMLLGLEENAILITNGDNDTYPGWILTRLLDHRSDVQIVNRSLLNTSWYPLRMIDEGLPRFITSAELDEIRETTRPPFSDNLIVRLIEAAEREGRPVYFSLTLYPSPVIDPFCENGRMLGLAVEVTTPKRPYAEALENMAETWINEYRTGGLDSWRIRFAKEGDANRMMMMNYPANILRLVGLLNKYAPEYRLDLFNWYREHCLNVIPQKDADEMGMKWREWEDIEEIQKWCLRQGYGI